MTTTAWARKARAVLKAIRVAAALSPDARVVYAHVFESLLDGGLLPSQPEMAYDLGMSEASLRRAIAELKGFRLLVVERHGSAPARYVLEEEGIRRVLAGELSAAFVRSLPAQDERTTAVETVPGPLTVSGQSTGSLRSKYIPPLTPPTAEMSGQSEAWVARRADAMLAALSRCGFGTSHRIRSEVVLRYAGDEDLTLEMFTEACEIADDHSRRTLAYLDGVLRRAKAEEAFAPGIVQLSEVRKRRTGGMG